ncbi:DDE transposase [Neptunitalea chrysea]|uniref:DDE transposase n=1 Tax=Neptunitalea chrysea TaxID=1647581 RepID=A0A9W6B6S1_9FLAO|nr:transposase [Neptunitalea chrysea]GLB53658.1 DDE transposase [Neptunitalea chrysea]
MNGKRLQHQYKHHLSGFTNWEKKSHSRQWLIYPENIGSHLSIDETSLSQGELYTIITNKKAKGKKGALVGIFKGTKAEPIINRLLKLPDAMRNKVQEITLDMAHSMKQIVKTCFPKALQVTDRFHVQKLAIDALKDLRIKYRWEAMDQENEQIKQSKEQQREYTPKILANRDTPKQLLARSRYLLYKASNDWTTSQANRATLLFDLYPELQKAYKLVNGLRNIFNQPYDIKVAYTKLAHCYRDVELAGFKSFQTVANSMSLNYRSILNYFINRNTNASAESFNAKIKAFRTQFRGVKNTEFFWYRLTKIVA